jgi:hypothetical protein
VVTPPGERGWKFSQLDLDFWGRTDKLAGVREGKRFLLQSTKDFFALAENLN